MSKKERTSDQDKKLEKLKKKLGKATIEEMDAMDHVALKKVIVEANTSMKVCAEELEANPKYQQVKQDKSYLESGKREVNARQQARIAYSLYTLEQRGEQGEPESEEA